MIRSPPPSNLIPFSAAKVKGGNDFDQATQSGSSDIKIQFSVNSNSDGLFPDQEPVIINLGPDANPLIPPTPCNLVAIPAGCFIQTGNNRYEVSDTSCGVTVTLRDLVTQKTIADLTPSVSSFSAVLVTNGKIGKMSVEMDYKGLNVISTTPDNVSISIGNDGVEKLPLNSREQYRGQFGVKAP